jgi:hypothetical protein
MTGLRRPGLDTSWMKDAECGTADPLLFELADKEHWKPGRFDEAAEYCRRCPVIAECDNYATLGKEKWGFWALKDRGEAKHAQRIANAEAKALQDAAVPVPGSEWSSGLRLALVDETASSRPDALGA